MLVLCTKEKESGRREKGKRRRNDGREREVTMLSREFFCFVFCFFSEKNHNLPTAEASSNLTKDIGC